MADIKKIIKQLKNTDLSEVKIENGAFKFAVKRDLSEVVDTITPAQTAPIKKRIPIKSPMVGRFYNSPAVDRPPFVMLGDQISSGQKVGVVEALKIFKDVISPVTGKIVEALVANNTSVEYGLELFLVEVEE